MTAETTIIEQDEEEYESWQFEHSSNLSYEFVYEEIMPVLDHFEAENDALDKDYIAGSATFGLFIELIHCLVASGWTTEDLKSEIETHANSSAGEILH